MPAPDQLVLIKFLSTGVGVDSSHSNYKFFFLHSPMKRQGFQGIIKFLHSKANTKRENNSRINKMAFEDLFRLSVHGVFTDKDGKILQLRSSYDGDRWGLPGGALDPAETIHVISQQYTTGWQELPIVYSN
jgi:hypothetical protein